MMIPSPLCGEGQGGGTSRYSLNVVALLDNRTMIIPTRRMMWLAATPLVVILASRGTPAAVSAAWILLGLLLAALVLDGLLARRSAVRLHRVAPEQLHVDQAVRVTWIVENRGESALRLILADRVPEGARATPLVLEVEVPRRTRTPFFFELVPTRRGPTAFGDLDYRACGPLGLAWSQRRLPARHEFRCMPHLANDRAADLAERRALLRQADSHRFRWRGAGTSFESLREYSTQDDMVFADQVELYLHPRRERAQLNAVAEGLYAREPRLVEPNYELALTLAASRNTRRTFFILLTDVTVIEAARRMLLYSRVLSPRHLFLVATIADETLEDNELREPQTAEELYRVGVAAGLMQERTVLLEELRRSGVEVLDSRADQIAARAIERYPECRVG
jgi:uncharacterized protein (DUF58 family)